MVKQSMKILRFHECPECGRLSPYLQSRCDCGYRFTGGEAQYKTCPECGSIIPSGQIVCDCGHVTLPKISKSVPPSPAIPSSEVHVPVDRAVSSGRPAAPAADKKIENYRIAQPHSQDPLSEAEEVLKQRTLQQTDGKVDRPTVRQTPYHTKKDGKMFTSRDFAVLVSMFVLIAVIVVIGITSKNDTVSSETHTPTFSEPDRVLTPVPVQNGQIIQFPLTEALAPLGVTTPSGENCYVYLSSLDGTPSNNMGFYVAADRFAEVSVPLGLYEIYYATGETWYGPEDLFGEETRRYQCEGTFDFYNDGEYYQGWTLELYLQENGNMDSDPVDENEWPA